VVHRTSAYLICGLVGTPLRPDQGPWIEALIGFAQVDDDGKPTPFPADLPAVEVPAGDPWQRLDARMKKLLRVR
jgi:hypothetical protein